jgi:hypothetical protein
MRFGASISIARERAKGYIRYQGQGFSLDQKFAQTYNNHLYF